ncbi:1483_t:CDS:2 [Dentiscutata erythropus]|uniref:1483_t:CDS:1 n=1 Tax=Dentiscutata erythropus TaxID=1348616 RepID=A0A9N9HA32_9GLOM|nr:1483_t:CDS:2 [Dentiscutata erythropus]
MVEENEKFKFKYDWFSYNIPNWETHLHHLKNEKINVLEIGSFEGRSTQMLNENIKMTGKERQIEVMKSISLNALTKLNHESKIKFDFIYIDGSHVASNVLADATLAWNLLKDGGIMIFDDYEWGRYKEEYNNPKIAIDAFIKCYNPEIEIIHKGYQISEIDDFPGHMRQIIMKFFGINDYKILL